MSTRRTKGNPERSRGREQALQVLYQSEICGRSATDIVRSGSYLDDVGKLDAFAQALIIGVEEHRPLIDDRIERISENWTLSRMSIVDRNILRIAVFELSYDSDIPSGVAINEAVELAKAFGQDDSSKFVNGILGKVAKEDAEMADAAPAAGDDGPADTFLLGDRPSDEPIGTTAPDVAAPDEAKPADAAAPDVAVPDEAKPADAGPR